MEQKPLYLNGEWVTTDTHLDVTDPATGDAFLEVKHISLGGMD